MSPNEPLPPGTPQSRIGKAATVLLWLVPTIVLMIYFLFFNGGLLAIVLIWRVITCPQCPFEGM